MKSERSRHTVLVTPPAAEHAGEVWALAPSPTVIICADPDAALEWVTAAPADRRVHAVTSLSYSAAVLRSQPSGAAPPPPHDVLAGAPQDLAALLTRAALKLDTIRSVVLAWPELLLAGEQAAALDTLLAELRDLPRVVLSWNPAALGDFLERHARRAEVVGALPVDADGRPLPPVAPARYVVVPRFRRPFAVSDWRDAVQARFPYVWSGGAIGREQGVGPCDAVLCTRLPTREEFRTLAAMGPVTVFASGGQLLYLRTLAAPLVPLPLPGAADRAQDRAEALRTQVAALLETGNVDAELIMLAPLFQRFEPAEVAAALLKLSHQPSAVGPPPPPPRSAGPCPHRADEDLCQRREEGWSGGKGSRRGAYSRGGAGQGGHREDRGARDVQRGGGHGGRGRTGHPGPYGRRGDDPGSARAGTARSGALTRRLRS